MTEQYDDPFSMGADTSGMEPEELKGGGNFVDEEGLFHVQIVKVELDPGTLTAEKQTTPMVSVTMEVLAGTSDAQIGKSTRHRLFLATWKDKKNRLEGWNPVLPRPGEATNGDLSPQAKGLLWFLHSFGVRPMKASQPIDRAMFERLEGCQAIIKVELGQDRTINKGTPDEKTFKGRHEMQWSNDCWPCEDEAVKDVPKDHEALALAGKSLASGATAPVASDLDDI